MASVSWPEESSRMDELSFLRVLNTGPQAPMMQSRFDDLSRLHFGGGTDQPAVRDARDDCISAVQRRERADRVECPCGDTCARRRLSKTFAHQTLHPRV